MRGRLALLFVVGLGGCVSKGEEGREVATSDPAPRATSRPDATVRPSSGPSAAPPQDRVLVDSAVTSEKLPFTEGASWVANGFYHLYGEVRNDTGKPVELVKVHIDLLDADGKALKVDAFSNTAAEEAGLALDSSDFATPDPSSLQPGETAIVGYLRELTKASAPVKGHKVTRVTAHPATKIATASVKSFQASPAAKEPTVDFPGFDVDVTIEAGPGGCRSPQLFVGVYAGSKLVHVGQEYFNDQFQKVMTPGQTATLKKPKVARIVTKDEGGPPFGDSAKLYVRCEPVE